LIFALALGVIWNTAEATDTQSIYLAFTAGVLCWGWQEISLYMGYVTGLRKQACAAGCSGWSHFMHAIEVNLWHELSIAITAALIALLCWGSANETALWTFMALWFMHLSARLNVFLGVRNVSAEFVPEHMAILKSFLTQKPMNVLFPFSVTALTAGAVLLGEQAFTTDGTLALQLQLLFALVALGLVEHWLLVLPVPVEKFWSWALSGRRDKTAQADNEHYKLVFDPLNHKQSKPHFPIIQGGR
jgi:putative photosynthetic complex assembly protein 2